jgi:hypothetical protein
VSLLEKQSWFADDFNFIFRKNSTSHEEKIWITPIYTWKLGGWYLVVTKPGISRWTIESSIDELKNSYPCIQIEYSSHVDGESRDGIKIEQYISQWVFSKYVDKNKFLYKDNLWKTYIWDYNEILETENEWMLLDLINNKIYLNGIKLTSKDIHSQNATIEILRILQQSIWSEVSNKELPLSSYSKNKNDMIWKIVLPLLKFIEKKTSIKLPIVCKWSITDFYLKMETVHLKISTVDRL